MKHKILLAVVLPLLQAGCFGNKQEAQKPLGEPVAEASAKQPFTEVAPAAPAPEATGSQYVGSKGAVRSVWGWRVQIFASATLENARKVAEEARWKFGDQQIYVSEAEPYYKVQAGNNLTRQDADNLKSRAKALGYKGVFVIEVNLAE